MSIRIEVDRLTLRYGSTVAVDDLSFTLGGGKIHGLLGRNGSGKTTLLSVLAAYRKATAGEIRIDGRPVFENAEAARRICFIRGAGDTVEHNFPQDRVSDALAFAGALRPSWDARYAAELVERFNLPPRARLESLSRGQRSAVGIVLGLASRAPLTIFDESHVGLDAPSRYAFYDALLAEHMAHARTFVISTHLIEEVGSLLEEVVIIDAGRLVLHEQADTLRQRGAAVTGAADAVDDFSAGRTVLAEKRLGPTKQAVVYGALDERDHASARAAGLELGPVALQDLFVHLTQLRENER